MSDNCPRCGSSQKNIGGRGKCDVNVGFDYWHVTPPLNTLPTRTHIDNPTNSTRFTNCCNVAVVKRYGTFERCPVCLREVVE